MTEFDPVVDDSVEIGPDVEKDTAECTESEKSTSESASNAKRSVSFSDSSATREIDTEMSACVWYTRAEVFLMVEDAKRTADLLDEKTRKTLRRQSSIHRAMKSALVLGRGCGSSKDSDTSPVEEVSSGDERRGLETIRWNPSYRRRRSVMKEVVKAVIAEQERQKSLDGSLDPVKIANVAALNGSTDTVLTAQKVGAQDEIVATLLNSPGSAPESQSTRSSRKSISKSRRLTPRHRNSV